MFYGAATVPDMIRKEVINDPKMCKGASEMIGPIGKVAELTAVSGMMLAIVIVGFLIFAGPDD